MTYRTLLRNAWALAVHERWRIGYALLGSIVIGSGFGSAIAKMFRIDLRTRILDALIGPAGDTFATITTLLTTARAHGSGALILLITYGVCIAVIIATFLGAVVVSANAIVRIAAERPASDTPIFRAARARFWSAAAVHAVVRCTGFIALAWWSVSLGRAVFHPTFASTAHAILAFVAVALALAALHVATPLALAGIVLDRQRPFVAIRDAFALLRDQWLLMLETSIVLTGVQVLGIAVSILGSVIIALPFLFLAGIGVQRGVASAPIFTTIIALPIMIVYIAAITALTTVVTCAVLVQRYLECTRPGTPSEPWIARILRRA